MKTGEIKRFIELIENTDIEELSFEQGDTKISIRRRETELVDADKEEAKSNNLQRKEKQLIAIKSPMVGTFYRAQSSDHPPLVMEGNHIVVGQKVAVIEAMKIMKDVISTVKGKIVKVLVENSQPVEFGQELFLVDTEEVEEGKK
ncbi:MAG: acetyl-CoA carboxylase, biotin carboxyl carrier protein [Elusimicrobiota bacterium]|nr:acetyl-CoA carboxylase, biotin carboxyl carrier protein [Elusimicrobiota bacterium]